jgi:hypothetical protein
MGGPFWVRKCISDHRGRIRQRIQTDRALKRIPAPAFVSVAAESAGVEPANLDRDHSAGGKRSRSVSSTSIAQKVPPLGFANARHIIGNTSRGFTLGIAELALFRGDRSCAEEKLIAVPQNLTVLHFRIIGGSVSSSHSRPWRIPDAAIFSS